MTRTGSTAADIKKCLLEGVGDSPVPVAAFPLPLVSEPEMLWLVLPVLPKPVELPLDSPVCEDVAFSFSIWAFAANGFTSKSVELKLKML